MSKEVEALNDLLLLSKLSDGRKKGMSALKRADYNAHIIYRALERAKKVEELLGLYHLEKEAKEKYHTSGSLYVMQHVLDELREIAEEINLKEKELEEMKWH